MLMENIILELQLELFVENKIEKVNSKFIFVLDEQLEMKQNLNVKGLNN